MSSRGGSPAGEALQRREGPAADGLCCRPESVVPFPALLIIGGVLLGLALRWAGRGYTTADTFNFLLPWYAVVREHGVAALGQTFTNYTPFYSYALLAAAQFDGVADPLVLIKAISLFFELGCAVVTFRLISLVHPRTIRPAVGFVAVWLAPSVLYNGALWGQADSLWCFFVLLSIYAGVRSRPAVAIVWFAFAVAVKAQAIFLAPFIFAPVLRGAVYWLWLGAIPVIYLAVALPAIAAGQSLQDVLLVYLRQAGTFHTLSQNAANLYIFIPDQLYLSGAIVGGALSAVAGLIYACVLASRMDRLSLEGRILAACLILLLMPFLLPKMHDRYFYAFEVLSISLALINPRYLIVTVAAQFSAIFSYFIFDGRDGLGLPVAAVSNLILLLFVARSFWMLCSNSRPNTAGKDLSAPSGLSVPLMTYTAASGVLAVILLRGLDLPEAGSAWTIIETGIFALCATVALTQLSFMVWAGKGTHEKGREACSRPVASKSLDQVE